MKRNLILLKTLLLSTSRINIIRHTTDQKKKRKTISGLIGVFILYGMMVTYSISTCMGYGQYGLIDSVPTLCTLTLSLLAFVFTFFKTNGYLFNFKEYDMLMSLPLEAKSVAGCKFLYMYIKSLPLNLVIALSMMVGYGMYAHPPVYVYLLWMVLSFVIPVIPMLAASFLGFLIARISAGFKKNNIMQTILTFGFIIMFFVLRYWIEYMFQDDKVGDTLNKMSTVTDGTLKFYPPGTWFVEAIVEGKISGALLLLGVSIVLFVVLFWVVGSSYRNINSSLKNHAASKQYRMKGQKKRSVVFTIAFKEFKRMTGSTTYLVNVGMGEILCILFSVAAIIVGFDKVVSLVTKNAPFDHAILQPAIPFIIYFFIGMVASTVCSPSLEGKQYWIVQSLPIEKKTLYHGKMLYNLLLTIPFALVSTALLSVSAKVPGTDLALYLLLTVVLCIFSTTWGCVCGIKHMRLDWENEIEVIKQSAAMAIYLFPNMFLTMGMMVLAVVLGFFMDFKLVALVMTGFYGVLALLTYLWAVALAKKEN